MTIACAAPDESLGVALRLSSYLDCQARALGQNGFEAFTGGPIVSGMLSGTITIFVALIGYRLLLGNLPTLRDGFGWAMRLGLVLALTSGWPAFQTLVYDVATQGPVDLATTLLPAIGLPSDSDTRIQDAYEIIGRGSAIEVASGGPAVGDSSSGAAPTSGGSPAKFVGFPPSPLAASLLVLSSVGIVAALRLAAGFLVAIGPLAIVALLFDNTAGLLASWIRALVGAALAVVGASVTSMLEIVLVESEIARMRDVRLGLLPPIAGDPAAFATIAAVFALIALIVVYASFRAAGGLRLRFATRSFILSATDSNDRLSSWRSAVAEKANAQQQYVTRALSTRTRADGISDALVSAAQRDATTRGAVSVGSQRQIQIGHRIGLEAPRTGPSFGQAGRRTSARRTRSAARRDRTV